MNAHTTPALPEPDQMTAQLTTALPRFRRVSWVQSTISTNADLMALARAEQGQLARPWLLGAHLQERGRGRGGRSWQNRAGANLMFSCAFDVFLPPRRLPTLSPLVGVAACEALRGLLSPAQRLNLTMKWPNDIQWRDAKLAGILVETTRAGASRLSPDHYVAIIGMGINLEDARALSQSLNRRVADWSEITREDNQAFRAGPAQITAKIATAWYDSLNDVTAHGFDSLPARYANVDALTGQPVHILDQDKLIMAGIASGIDSQGQLLLRTPEGETAINVGEVSVRPRQEYPR
ncbi:biotin--[acetyl-CoA-carboxylase] ligase [Allopusillimonas ginsengisoli]|uniref:biotin--[acetyl-CoA-carboxylase] ligase n=1 Tax=Allopusillimonas ginsengisoli TaxID=453575 RepID=UPI00102149D8|nr:biotin--[acetyl-CoA-carboxylase] ligase [Allopusillimonas ginsengisoli]TEA77853.1 biotin--[acetyl-CoA-carboxylase] ligase [Allopusillimonas ginsengisoli]